jgi:hypothetical protein
MRIVIQRVSRASVTIGGNVKSAIGKGFLILLGVEESDTEEDVEWLVKKVIGLRVFDDENGVMNLSIGQVDGDAIDTVAAVGQMECLVVGAGCGEKGIEGTWVLVKETTSDGETLNESDLKEKEISEEYVIEGSTVQYTLNAPMVKKPITMKLTLEEAGDKQYIFKIKECFLS